jgi:hypothetical protein
MTPASALKQIWSQDKVEQALRGEKPDGVPAPRNRHERRQLARVVFDVRGPFGARRLRRLRNREAPLG